MKTVAFLGAGASVPAGMLLATDLTGATLDAARSSAPVSLALNYVVSSLQLADTRAGAEARALPDIERLVSAVEMIAERGNLEAAPFVLNWDAQIDQLERAKSGNLVTSRNNLERSLEAFVRAASSSKNTFGRRPNARAVVAAIESMIERQVQIKKQDRFAYLHSWLIQQVAILLALEDAEKASYLRPLAKWSAASQSLIASLNYDLTLEAATRLEGIPCARGVEGWAATGQLDAPEQGASLLVKLHGSLDWKLRDDSFNPNPNPDQPFQGSMLPAIIYGRRNKLTPYGPFLQLLERFRQALFTSDNLLVIGYSFHDAHINVMIERWLNTNDSARVAVVEWPGFKRPRNGWQRDSAGFVSLWQRYGPGRRPEYVSNSSGRPTPRPPSEPLRFAVDLRGVEAALIELEGRGMDGYLEMVFDEAMEVARRIDENLPR